VRFDLAIETIPRIDWSVPITRNVVAKRRPTAITGPDPEAGEAFAMQIVEHAVAESALVKPGAVAADVAITVRDVAKTFAVRGDEVRALERVRFSVLGGEFVSVLGPSGCGKSTLLRIIAGLIRCDPGGDVEVFGRRRVGVADDTAVVFQSHNMLPWLTVEGNLRLAAEVRRMPAADIDQRVEALLPVLKLEAFRRRFPHELSGGMRQRAGLGQALVLRPQLLLLDEPFGALDALTRDQLNVELLRLWQEVRKTVLLITHSIAEAVFLSDRVLVMSERPGTIVDDIAIDLPRPRDPQTTKAAPEFAQYILHLNQLMGVK
jgi:NitT/TauT family transport system ATP-binding protein